MEVKFWAATDVGITRDHNEDNFLVDKKLNLFVVADGMGGHAAGEVASAVAVREVRRIFAERRELIEAYELEGSEGSRKAILRLIEEAIQTASARIFEMGQEDAERHGMGTTTSLLLVVGKRGFIGHVGDSRIYMTRDGQVIQKTEDHSLENELRKRGRLQEGEKFDGPYKNAVTRAVGVYKNVEVDAFDFELEPGDNFLLCSDGLHCYLTDSIIREYLDGEQIKEIPERFIHLANESGGKDNITAVVVRVLEGDEDEQNRRLADVRRKLEALRGVSLFKYLNYASMIKVLNLSEMRHLSAGQVIFEERAYDDRLYIIISGHVRMSIEGTVVTVLDEGQYFGEMALFEKAPRSMTATAVDDVRIMTIARSHLYELMRLDPLVSVKLMWCFIQLLSNRLRVSTSELQAARNAFSCLKRGETVELPPQEAFLMTPLISPQKETDELIPGFLFSDMSGYKTEQLVHEKDPIDATNDLDSRPCSMVSLDFASIEK